MSSLVSYFLEKGYLVSPDFLSSLDEGFDEFDFHRQLQKRDSLQPFVLSDDVGSSLGTSSEINWSEFEKSRVVFEKKGSSEVYDTFLSLLSSDSEVLPNLPESVSEEESLEGSVTNSAVENNGSSVVVLKNHQDPLKKKSVQDFVDHFRSRYEALKNILLSRVDLQNSISLSRLARKQHGEEVSLIGFIVEKNFTKNGNLRLKLEDPTGFIDILVNKNKEEIFRIASDCVLDEVVGVVGALGQNIVFCNKFFLPDIPQGKEFKKCPEEVYMAVISDIHVGLDLFLEEDFKNFIKWTRGEFGNEKHRAVSSKLKYIFLNGDLVEGVGIYPGQENDLSIQDITKQYDRLAELISEIPSHIHIIVCGGNHDALRLAEPQPQLDMRYASALYELPNVINVSNPSVINIHASDDFPGFDVLMYHGYSIPFYAANVPSIRQVGGMDRTDLIMKYFLQRRHLAPSHGSNLYIPTPDHDPLVIDKVPDFFLTGHVHRACAMNYKGVTLINSSCWASQSEDNVKRGIVPTPSRVPLVNLKTREVKFMNFLKG